MGSAFVLGPSEWVAPRPGPTPMDHRRAIAAILRGQGHRAILMEDEQDESGEDIVEKFERLLASVSDVVLVWPPQAKMSTTFSEMVLLRKLNDTTDLPRLWFLHHEDVAAIERGRFVVKEAGGRSRYLMSLARLGIVAVPWGSIEELRARARAVASEIGGGADA